MVGVCGREGLQSDYQHQLFVGLYLNNGYFYANGSCVDVGADIGWVEAGQEL